MNKILTSKWFAGVIAIVAFVLTMLVLWKPAAPQTGAKSDKSETDTNGVKKAEVPAPAPSVLHETVDKPIVKPAPEATVLPTQVGEPGSLKFNNPEVSKLVEELLEEKRKLREREDLLNQMARRLAGDKEWIASITNSFLTQKAEFEKAMTNHLNLQVSNEGTNLLHLARAYTNMSPSTAMTILDGMDDALAARILMQMGDVQRAAILENFATNKNVKTEGKATQISEKIRLFSAPPKTSKK